jgi:predicted O-methyltransferase YrrM
MSNEPGSTLPATTPTAREAATRHAEYPRWIEVEDYVTASLHADDPALDEAVAASDAAGLPPIAVSPTQGRFLSLLARIQKSRRILELGTLGGYSTIWLARALEPGGRLITLELDPARAAVASANIARAGLADLVDIRVGDALSSLQQLVAAGEAPFDLIFIDADKQRIPDYFTAALSLSARGSVIVVDNIVRDGAVIDSKAASDPAIDGIRRFYEMAGAEPRVDATALQTVGSKGYDGFAVLLVTG